MTVDALVLVGENRFGPTIDIDSLLATCDREGIEHVVAAPARPLDYHLAPANESLARVRDDHPDRITLLGRVDPTDGDRAFDLAERCLDELGARGLFLHPGEEWFTVARARPVIRVAAERGVPVVVATGYFALAEPLQVADVAADFPDTPVIMTTGGQINISGLSMIDAVAALERQPNLHVMTNGEYRQDFIERLGTEFDHSRVLWASFAPAFDQRFELRRIRSARLPGTARAAIEHGNAERLFTL